MNIELEQVCIDPGEPLSAGSRSSSSTGHHSATSVNTPLKEEERPQKPTWLGNKTFKCGDPYEAPYPQVDGDPWEKVYRVVKEYDDTMCDAWMDEIQNLLILAGLFSAIVTAFVIETQKLLQEDPTTTSTLFLAHIASQLAANSSFRVPLPSTTLQPLDNQSVAHAFRINAFLFLSLVISLSTALFGILVLQWIRSYRKRETLSYQDLLGLRQCRYDGLVKWKVPEIVSALPILLQFGLVIFFVGLVDFLHFLYPKLSIVIGVFVGLVIFVLVLTTILPSLILFKKVDLHNPLYWAWMNRHTLCAYQSPQSWIFLQGTYWAFQPIVNWLVHRKINTPHNSYGDSWYEQLLFVLPSDYHRNWTSFVESMSFGAWAPYSLSWVLQNFNNTPEPLWAGYQCFKTLDSAEAKIMTLHDLSKSTSWLAHSTIMETQMGDYWRGDKLPTEQFRQDLEPLSNSNFINDFLSLHLLLLWPDQDTSGAAHHAECYLRSIAELEVNPSLDKLWEYLPPGPGRLECAGKVQRRYIWYLECSLLRNPRPQKSPRTYYYYTWYTFWNILGSEWDDLTVITPDEGLSLLHQSLTEGDLGTQVDALDALTVLFTRDPITNVDVLANVLHHAKFLACLDFVMSDGGRVVCQATRYDYTDVNFIKRWVTMMKTYKVDDKYAEVFSSLPLV